MPNYRLFASKGCGSAIVEAALDLCDLAYTTEWLPYLEPGPAREQLLALNITGQVPTLVLPDGQVMTESAAIVLYLGDRHPNSGLIPQGDKAAFLRWLIFLVSEIYPTFNYGDDPQKWGLEGSTASDFHHLTDDYRMELWHVLEKTAAGTPYFLPSGFSALDIYITVMSQWRPGPTEFNRRNPRLASISRATAKIPRIAAVLARNF